MAHQHCHYKLEELKVVFYYTNNNGLLKPKLTANIKTRRNKNNYMYMQL